MIIPRPRLLLLLLPGFLLAAAGFYIPLFLPLQFVMYAVLLLAVIIDILRIPRKSDISAIRSCEKYLSIGADNPIKIEITNNSTHHIIVDVRDEYPSQFINSEDTGTLTLEVMSFGTIRYHVKPVHKGSYTFKSIYVRVHSRLGLITRQYRYMEKTDIVVYPNLIELRKFINLASQNRQEQLGYRKRIHGGKTEIDYLREFQSGDDYRKINWKATARRRLPIVEVDQEEFNRNIMVLLDTGRMMTTRYGNLTKLDYAIDTGLILAAAALQKKDRFGMLTFSHQIEAFLPPSRKNNLLTTILSTMYNTVPAFTKSDYMMTYQFLKKRVTKNSIIFVFSEMYNRIISQELVDMLLLLSRTHRVYFISFEEEEEPAEGDSMPDITRWVLQHEQIVEKELLIRDLSRKGVNTIRVSPRTIKQTVVTTYLSS